MSVSASQHGPLRELRPREDSVPSVGGALSSLQSAGSLILLRGGGGGGGAPGAAAPAPRAPPLCTAEQRRGALCESFPVILLREVLPFFKARFDIFTGLTSGAFLSRKEAGILSFIFTKPLIGFFIKLDSIISSIRVGAQLYLVQNIKQS